MKIDKSGFKDVMGRALTQSLFLEPNYNTDFAYYTLEGEDKVYKGRTYPSLKKLYLAAYDPLEYEFANTYLLDWDHWVKMQGNAILNRHIEKWREELELKIRSESLRMILDQSEDNYQAAKFLAEQGWKKAGVGRPKKEKVDKQLDEHIANEFANDVLRMEDYKK
jgi:hypothetical protein